ncbi:glycosyltransferase family 2 protein [Algoriphagus sp. AK58]|uniref:glycosyltransferase family 2 protein n=1 Tax=Algoriphagus sp. AK58 TaxID=1406877 RepID=UPI00164FA411|nr:glycosyltransferase family 2 protein [Algoriphagus sp. AK58]MBC6368277.1 glycosyl transferase family 2 [Algoriphagus sp. AK58]
MRTCAIVILNYNGENVLRTFLPSVKTNSYYDLWVIDNASTDRSVEILQLEFPEFGLIRLKANLGFTGGYNWGLEELRDKYTYFILLNSDVEVTPNWDNKLIDFLEANRDFAAVQPKILSWTERHSFDYAGAGGGFLDALGYPYCRGRIWNHLEKDLGQYDDAITVDWASGACMAIRSKDFFEQQGFDAHFFAHMEEIDLCWRLRKSGKKIGYLGAATVYHQGGATLDRASSKKLYLNIRNSLSMLYKNVSVFRFILIFLAKVGLESLASFNYLLKGKSEFSKAILEGYIDFFKTRMIIQKTQKSPNHEIQRSGPVRFILIQYMILGVRKFSDL